MCVGNRGSGRSLSFILCVLMILPVLAWSATIWSYYHPTSDWLALVADEEPITGWELHHLVKVVIFKRVLLTGINHWDVMLFHPNIDLIASPDRVYPKQPAKIVDVVGTLSNEIQRWSNSITNNDFVWPFCFTSIRIESHWPSHHASTLPDTHLTPW